MPGTFTYGLYPWQWLTEAGQSFHAPPTGAASVLDFRPIPAQGTQGQSAGWGLFAWPDGVAVPGDLVSLGTGYIATLQPSTAARNELRLKLGLAQNPAGATLVDCIADILGPLSVPDGSTGPKPLMPAADGTLEIQLAAHSRVWSSALDPANLLSSNPNSRHNRIRDVIRDGIDTADDIGGLELARKVLGSWLLTCGFSREEIRGGAPGKVAQWQRLLSTKVKLKHAAKLVPKEPKTSFSETWPNDCADIEATGQDQTWTTVSNTIQVSSGRAQATGGITHRSGYCSSAVSSANHIVTCDVWEILGYAGGLSRGSTSGGTDNGYFGGQSFGSKRIAKYVSSVYTLLGQEVGVGARFGIRSNGSTQTVSSTGQSDLSVTDTAITGNLIGGIVIYIDAPVATYAEIDNWTIDDELPSPPVAAFSGTPLSGTSPLSVAFTYGGTGGTPDTYAWEKTSNGTDWVPFSGTPTVANPTESLTTGTWGIRVTATNSGGASISTRTSYITVTAPSSGGSGARLSLLGVG